MMAKWNRNGEGYADSTAGIAIQKVSREERKIAMGKKGICADGCERTWFKKGHIPANYRPVGSERVNADGYIEVKVADPNK